MVPRPFLRLALGQADAKVVYVEGSGCHKLANIFAGTAAETWQHLLLLMRYQYESALARRAHDGAAQPAKPTRHF